MTPKRQTHLLAVLSSGLGAYSHRELRHALLANRAQTQPVLLQPQSTQQRSVESELQRSAALQRLDVHLVGGEVDGGGDWGGEGGSKAGGGCGDVHDVLERCGFGELWMFEESLFLTGSSLREVFWQCR